MPTNILRPLAEGFYTAATLIAGASKVAAVDTGDPVAHDDATTYVQIEGAVAQSFTLTGKPAADVEVTAVRHGSRGGQLAGGPAAAGRMRLSSTDGADAWTSSGAAWVTTGPSTAPRPGGGSWSGSDIASSSLEMIVVGTVGGGGNFWGITSMWVEVDWEPPRGGFAFLLALGPIASLLGAGLTFAEFCRALTYLPDVHYTADETLDLWRELRAYRHPTFFLPAVA